MTILHPPHWPRPRGYVNGVATRGTLVFVAGQVGWQGGAFASDDLVEQVAQALRNTLAVLREAGAGPEHVTRMTWYILDKAEYKRREKEIGRVYRELMGKHFPAMAMVVVAGLMEDAAKVEIETTAVIPDDEA
jgi:enamine deaminase RidA (YjgF/YER057c/UK114 family)